MNRASQTKEQWVIIDWAWNYLQHTGKFNFSAGGHMTGVPMIFETQDDGFEYMDIHSIDYDECYCVQLRPENKGGLTPARDVIAAARGI